MAGQQQHMPELQLQQLGEARNLVLKDPAYWPQVVQGTLPIITGPLIEVRRWGADFLAESFSTPVLDARAKQELALQCLDTLLRLSEERDAGILKSVAQCCASLYPIIFRHVCATRNDTDTWNKITALKSRILGFWDTGPIGVRLACIKFVQRVVLVQSRGVTDPRLIDRSDTNLSSVPPNHPLLSLPSLDAEAQGLLDRLISALQEEQHEPTLITATLNNCGALIKMRPPIAPKVLSAVMSFNPFASVTKPLTTQNRLMMLSMEKTVRVLLINIVRSAPTGPYVNRISQHLARLSQAKAELSEELSRKRSSSAQDREASKRAKMEKGPLPRVAATPTPTPTPPPAPAQQIISGPLTYAQLYTLATDPAMTSFDGKQLPLDLVLQIVVGSMFSVNRGKLNAAIAAINDRYAAFLKSPQNQVPAPGPSIDPSAAAGQLVRQQKQEEMLHKEDELALQLGEFRLPPPPPIPPQNLQLAAVDSLDRMISITDEFEKTSLIQRKSRLGVNRLAASNWDREGWVSMLIRLPTRGVYRSPGVVVKSENREAAAAVDLADVARERLYNYIVSDFRGRMDIAVAWLNEEWYHDRLTAGQSREPQYQKWLMRVMDSIFPFLEARDRMFLRLMSEIPEVPMELVLKLKMLCLDPDRTILGIQALHFMTMLRPPAREACLDVLEDLWEHHAELRKQVKKLLSKWRPSALADMERVVAEANTFSNGSTAVVMSGSAPPESA